ncbi:hypothetical protein LPJ73_006473 [Coemansia sp. RSA 2703]|nr:hypothetical protein LPJ73_006473 [Coemansia sp. RSA 2703]KAJ2362786.1 hypothetical protein IW150_006913 [Coemansia sp. RSA 2607]KAJ2380396.1 hypothetical protein GGI05_006320 [Coemansia sp. RSA 2603]
MFVNSFTQNIPQTVELKQITSGNTKKQAYPESIDVRLELRGIKQGWITSKQSLIRIFDPEFFTKPGSRKGNDKGNAVSVILIALATMVYTFVARLSVQTLVTIIYCVLLSSMMFSLSIKDKLLFWLSPSSRWVGYSRAGFGIYFVANLFAIIAAIVAKGFSNLLNILIMLPPLLLLLIMTETPKNPMTWYDALRQGIQSSQRYSDNSGAYTMINLEEGDDEGQNPIERPQIKDPELVVSIRRDIDRVALWWTIRLLGPVFALVFVYSLFTSSLQKTQLGTFAYIVINYATVLQWCQWIPQIVVNYKTQSGTWIPVLANAYELAATLLFVVAIEVSGFSLSLVNMYRELPNQIFNAILVAQWIKYRFF